MCGIVGYIGNNQAAPVLLHGLGKLEYRGYDSAEIAVRNGDEPVQIVKAKGRLKILEEKTASTERLKLVFKNSICYCNFQLRKEDEKNEKI